MNEEQFEIVAMDYLAGTMPEDKRRDFEKFLENNPKFRSELQELKNTWQMVAEIKAPEAPESMDNAFFGMLSDEIEKGRANNGSKRFFEGLWSIPKPQLVFGMLLLVLGIGIGYFLDLEDEIETKETIVANEETENVRQKLVLTLLDQPSANQRLQGVSEANKFKDADEIVIGALLQTLNKDSNVNVRLAAIESLTSYVDNPIVRQGLVQSIPNQDAPMLQITLANLMVALQEKASIAPFKELLREKKLDTTVQKKLENSIKSII